MKKFFIIFLTIIVLLLTIILQTNIIDKFPMFGILANLGIVFVSIVSVSSNEEAGIAIGGFYGLVIDVLIGRTLGVYTLLFLLVGYGLGKIKTAISFDNKFTIFALVVSVTLLFEFSELFIGLLLHGYNNINTMYVLKVLIISAIYNSFLTYVFYRPYAFLGKQILNCNKKYYL